MDDVPPRIEAAIHALIGQIPGITILTRRPAYAEESVSEVQDAIAVEVDAWGPTLHTRRLEWMVPTMVPVQDAQGYALAPTEEMSEDEIIAHMPIALHKALRVQRLLADLAAGEGLDAPLPDPERVGARDIMHIHADPRLIALMIGIKGAEATLQDLVDALGNVLGDDDGVHADHIGSISGGVHHVALEDGHPVLSTRVHFARLSHCEGNTLVVSGLLPETAVAALPGRPLSALVRTGCAELDEATISKAISFVNAEIPSRSSVTVALESESVRLGDHPILGPLVRALG